MLLTGGTIDTNGHDVTLSGAFGSPQALEGLPSAVWERSP